MHVIAAKAVCFKEALSDEFKTYQQQIINNAQALASGLINNGVKILTGGTDNHLMLADLRGTDVTGKELQRRCDEVHITLNKNTVPNDPQKAFVTSGVRIGTPAVTARGMKEPEMKKIAELIALCVNDFESKTGYITDEVAKLCEKFPIY